MVYASIVDNRIIGFYPEGLYETIPLGCIQITEELWKILMDDTMNYKMHTGLSTDVIYSSLEEVAILEPLTLPTINVLPSQLEIDFAEYVIATEDRIAVLEAKLIGGV